MEVPEEERFARNVLVMAQAIHEAIVRLNNAGHKSVNPQIVELAIAIIPTFGSKQLIEGFITNSHVQCWDFIKQRNEEFFINNCGQIFQHLPMDKVGLFKELFTAVDSKGNSIVPQILKDQLWRLFDAMVKISIKYVHKHRSPRSLNNVPVYQKSFFDDVNLEHHGKLWEIAREFPFTK